MTSSKARLHEPAAQEPSAPLTVEGETFPSSLDRIEYPSIAIPEPGETVAVVPGILWLRIPMPMDLNHINLWLLDEGDGYTLIDSGLCDDLCKESWMRIESTLLQARPLKRIFVTHLHPDHIGLAHWLQQRHQVPVWMSARGHALATLLTTEASPAEIAAAEGHMRNHGFADPVAGGKFLSGALYRSRVSGIPKIEHASCDGDALNIGGYRWQIFETDGHAEGHQCLFDAARQILISGDQVLPTISSNVSYSPRGADRNPLASYLASLERLAALDQHTLVLPSHGRPFYGLRFRAMDLIAHHREHLQALRAACASAHTAYELVPVLFKRRLVGPHWMFAMGETIAHLEYLALAGEFAREVAADGTIRYRWKSDR